MFIDFEGRSGFCLIPQATKYNCPVANCPEKDDEKQDAGLHLVRFSPSNARYNTCNEYATIFELFLLKHDFLSTKSIIFLFENHHCKKTWLKLSNSFSFHFCAWIFSCWSTRCHSASFVADSLPSDAIWRDTTSCPIQLMKRTLAFFAQENR
jgi:hypothetical protein